MADIRTKSKAKKGVIPVDEIMTIGEAAKFLRLSERTLFRLVKAKRMPAKKVGGQWRFSRSALQDWVGVPKREEMGNIV